MGAAAAKRVGVARSAAALAKCGDGLLGGLLAAKGVGTVRLTPKPPAGALRAKICGERHFHPAHAPNSVEYASITPVILSEMTSGPLDDASYTAEMPRNQLQHAPTKPYSLAGLALAPEISLWICSMMPSEPGGASAVDSRVERMHYYLKHTLGCPHTFEDRRRELAILGEATEPVSDERVVDSLVSDILPGGCLRAYLENACLAAILGNTIVVHGALEAEAMQLVPDDATRFSHLPASTSRTYIETSKQCAAQPPQT